MGGSGGGIRREQHCEIGYWRPATRRISTPTRSLYKGITRRRSRRCSLLHHFYIPFSFCSIVYRFLMRKFLATSRLYAGRCIVTILRITGETIREASEVFSRILLCSIREKVAVDPLLSFLGVAPSGSRRRPEFIPGTRRGDGIVGCVGAAGFAAMRRLVDFGWRGREARRQVV